MGRFSMVLPVITFSILLLIFVVADVGRVCVYMCVL